MTEAYLEPSRKSTMELCSQKSSIVDVWLGSNKPLHGSQPLGTLWGNILVPLKGFLAYATFYDDVAHPLWIGMVDMDI